VADQLERPPVLVGASLGGMSALLAEGTSDRVVSSALALVDIAPIFNNEGIQRIGAFMRSGASGFSTLEDAAAAIATFTPQRNREFNAEGLGKVLRERDGKWFWHWDPRLIEHERTEVLANRFAGLLDVAMNNILVPTLLVRGLESDVLTQEGVDSIVARLPDITVAEVQGAGHMIAGDRNDAFTNAVTSFLSNRVRPLLPK